MFRDYYESDVERVKWQSYHVDHLKILRNNTRIGDEIEFDIPGHRRGGEKVNLRTIKGTVTEKFAYTFRLDDKATYTWNQYLLGCKNGVKEKIFSLKRISDEFRVIAEEIIG